MSDPMHRRDFLTATGAAAAGLAAGAPSVRGDHHGAHERGEGTQPGKLPKKYQNGRSPWPVCLDGFTIRPADLERKVEIAAEAGFDAFEPWEDQLDKYEKDGGDLKALGRKIDDLGLFVPSMIGLWSGVPPTREKFEKNLETQRRRMRQAADVGARHVQVISTGTDELEGERLDLNWAAEAYRRLLVIGREEFDLTPAMVFVKWHTVKRLGQAAAIALDADHPHAQIIPDVFHMHINGDTGLHAIKHIQGSFIAIFQFNDAPTDIPYDKLKDKDRVFPGDGGLPLGRVLRDLERTGFTGCVSLELYNRDYWEQMDMETIAKKGLEKTVRVIDEAV